MLVVHLHLRLVELEGEVWRTLARQYCLVLLTGRTAAHLHPERNAAIRTSQSEKISQAHAGTYAGMQEKGRGPSCFPSTPRKETPSVNPSCGRWLALARCHRGGSPRTFQRAASSPRGAQATPHPGKKNDRAPPPPASPRRAAPRLASPRLAAAHAHTHPRARARSARAKQPSKRVPNREPKGPGSNREPVRPPPLAVLAKASKAVLDIT